jgi:hypothetical protein
MLSYRIACSHATFHEIQYETMQSCTHAKSYNMAACSVGESAICPDATVWFASRLLLQGTAFAASSVQKRCLAAAVNLSFYNSVAPPAEELLEFQADCGQRRFAICMKERGVPQLVFPFRSCHLPSNGLTIKRHSLSILSGKEYCLQHTIRQRISSPAYWEVLPACCGPAVPCFELSLWIVPSLCLCRDVMR